MIASVVASIAPDGRPLSEILEEISGMEGVEVGEPTSDNRRFPMTIDSSAPTALEETTDRLRNCDGVVLVDVVFVHFEDNAGQGNASLNGEQLHEHR